LNKDWPDGGFKVLGNTIRTLGFDLGYKLLFLRCFWECSTWDDFFPASSIRKSEKIYLELFLRHSSTRANASADGLIPEPEDMVREDKKC